MNFLQIDTETFIEYDAIEVITRDDHGVLVVQTSRDRYVVNQEYESRVLACAVSNTVTTTFGRMQ